VPLAHEGRTPNDAPSRARTVARAGTTKEGDAMTNDWTLRRCDSCGVLESDLRAVLVVDNHGDVVHLQDGLFRCGVVVDVDEVTP
jgi:hypothetical protein